jgi:MFS family permease
MMALTANWFVAGKRGLAAGILTMGTGLGLSIVGVALPHVIAKYGPNGWRYAWFLLGTLVFILSFVCFALLRDNPAEKRTSMYGGEEKQKSRKPVTLKELIETDFGIFLITFSISALAGAPGTQKWAFKTSQVVNSFPAIGYP